jgi:hypothetical protein
MMISRSPVLIFNNYRALHFQFALDFFAIAPDDSFSKLGISTRQGP